MVLVRFSAHGVGVRALGWYKRGVLHSAAKVVGQVQFRAVGVAAVVVILATVPILR